MRFINLPYEFNSYKFILSKWTGNLFICNDDYKYKIDYIPEKVKYALEKCNNPYSISLYKKSDENLLQSEKKDKIALRMLKISRVNFFIAIYYASIKKNLFSDSIESIKYFNNLLLQFNTNDLCLPRSLFSAKTSKAFNIYGVIFIGVYLPSRSMHAWVIENGMQPDSSDNIWHHYRPIAAIY
jgi:hypothetical protein